MDDDGFHEYFALISARKFSAGLPLAVPFLISLNADVIDASLFNYSV
jgi:hypothetical protein